MATIFHKEAKKYDRIEFTGISNNDKILIKRPDGKTDEVIPFVYQPIRFEYDCHGYESLYDDGEAEFRARYTPELCGEYYVNGKKFYVSESQNKGYIKVGNNDRRYFVYDDGSTYFPVGINMAYPTKYTLSSGFEFELSGNIAYLGLRQYRSWLDKCAQNGVNLVRLWIGHEYFTPDTEETSKLDYKKSSLLDEIIELARERNIKLKLTLEQFRYFNYDNKDEKFPTFSKKLYHNGQPCLNAKEWLEDEKWQNAWCYKLEEFSKRFSGDTVIFCIEIWNEMACLGVDVAQWCKKKLPEIKKMFPKHLITNSYPSLESNANLELYKNFCWEETDFIQVHRYIDQGAPLEICNFPIDMMEDAVSQFSNYKKPIFIAETGAVNDFHSGQFRFYSSDDRGIIFADTVYSPVFFGGCGIGNIWHWDDRYVESKNLYRLYRPIANVFSNINFQEEEFVTKNFSNDEVYMFSLYGKSTHILYIRNKQDTWQNVLRDLNLPETVKQIAIPDIKNAEIISIWDEETAYLTGNILNNLKYGVFIKGLPVGR